MSKSALKKWIDFSRQRYERIINSTIDISAKNIPSLANDLDTVEELSRIWHQKIFGNSVPSNIQQHQHFQFHTQPMGYQPQPMSIMGPMQGGMVYVQMPSPQISHMGMMQPAIINQPQTVFAQPMNMMTRNNIPQQMQQPKQMPQQVQKPQRVQKHQVEVVSTVEEVEDSDDDFMSDDDLEDVELEGANEVVDPKKEVSTEEDVLVLSEHSSDEDMVVNFDEYETVPYQMWAMEVYDKRSKKGKGWRLVQDLVDATLKTPDGDILLKKVRLIMYEK
ncbi:hypothetical protein PCE1_001697 [Barthelona sp. PCE]